MATPDGPASKLKWKGGAAIESEGGGDGELFFGDLGDETLSFTRCVVNTC